jgi:hypothetical protein
MRYRELLEDNHDGLVQQGFDVTEILYHGSSTRFSTFDMKKARTAKHIYTSPSRETAATYGDHVYECFGRQYPQADLIDDNEGLIRRLAETFFDRFEDAVEPDEGLQALKARIFQEILAHDPDAAEWDAEDDPRYKTLRRKLAIEYTADILQNGRVYESADGKGYFQDEIIDECLWLGYKSVRLFDYNSEGDWVSVVFGNPEDVVIVREIS